MSGGREVGLVLAAVASLQFGAALAGTPFDEVSRSGRCSCAAASGH